MAHRRILLALVGIALSVLLETEDTITELEHVGRLGLVRCLSLLLNSLGRIDDNPALGRVRGRWGGPGVSICCCVVFPVHLP